jgi:carboxymethylenebutenolidase
MDRYEINVKTVQVPNHTLMLDAYLAQPNAPGSFPAVIVFQEIFGVNAHIKDITERVARQGYVAIAPALYQRVAPGFESGYDAASIQMGKEYKAQTTAANLLSDTQATIAFLQKLPNVNSAALGTLGFCFGGHVAYLVATLPEVKATASFYGAGVATLTLGGDSPTITRTAEIRGVLYAFFGSQDASIPLEEMEQIETELTAHAVQHRIFAYPAAHGFFCDRRDSYQPEAAADAWHQTLQLFEKELAEH